MIGLGLGWFCAGGFRRWHRHHRPPRTRKSRTATRCPRPGRGRYEQPACLCPDLLTVFRRVFVLAGGEVAGRGEHPAHPPPPPAWIGSRRRCKARGAAAGQHSTATLPILRYKRPKPAPFPFLRTPLSCLSSLRLVAAPRHWAACAPERGQLRHPRHGIGKLTTLSLSFSFSFSRLAQPHQDRL